MAGEKGRAGAATLLMTMVVVFAMVAVQQVSALQTPNDYINCVADCVFRGGCPWYVPSPACGLYCAGKCAVNHISTAEGYCHMGCITSTCITTASSSNPADNEACFKGCANICGSSPTFTPTYKVGRNPVV